MFWPCNQSNRSCRHWHLVRQSEKNIIWMNFNWYGFFWHSWLTLMPSLDFVPSFWLDIWIAPERICCNCTKKNNLLSVLHLVDIPADKHLPLLWLDAILLLKLNFFLMIHAIVHAPIHNRNDDWINWARKIVDCFSFLVSVNYLFI